MTEPAAQPSDPPRRTTTGAIPLHWAMPAELSVNAAGLAPPSEKRTLPPTKRRATPASLAAVVVVSVGLGLVVGFFSEDIERALAQLVGKPSTTTAAAVDVAPTDVPPAPTGATIEPPVDAPLATEAAAAPENGALTVVVEEPSIAPPTEPAPVVEEPAVDAAPVEAAPENAPPVEGEAVVVDAAPEGDVATAKVATPSSEPSSEDVVPLRELPVRKKVRQMVTRAEGHIKAGRFDDAVLVLQRAEIVDGSYPLLHRTRGIAEASRGQTDAARQAYRRYLRLAPNAPDAADVRRILGE